MKTLFLFAAACFTLALYSCTSTTGVKPSNTVVTDTITATINGVNESFNVVDSARYHNTSAYYSISVYAKSSADALADQLELSIYNQTPITAGTYTLPQVYNPPYSPLIVYKVQGSSNFADDYVIDYTAAHEIAITITSISSTQVKGTFSGTLVVAAGTSGATKTITNGKFNVLIK